MRYFRSLAWASIFLGGSMMAWGAAEKETPPAPAVEKDAKVKQAEADLKAMGEAMKSYKLAAGDYPTVQQGLQSLIEIPKAEPRPRRWVQLMAKIPKDPWGRDYRYLTRKKKDETIEYVIICGGSDDLSPDDDIEVVLKGDEK